VTVAEYNAMVGVLREVERAQKRRK
jgi:hypothetical protein